MPAQHRTGAAYLSTATTLLRRIRHAHPTAGLLEAADLHWWWRKARPTDGVPQLFWFDAAGRPEAAVIATDWDGAVALDPIVMPDATLAWRTQVMDDGLAHARACGFGAVDVVIDAADLPLREVLRGRGFEVAGGEGAAASAGISVVCAWLAAPARPALSPLRGPYRLVDRRDAAAQAHHMVRRSGVDVEARLRQSSLYRPELDLLVLDGDDTVAAYALFWFDPATATGLVEPLRTEDPHQGRGLARHLLTAGIDRLARLGAERVKICFQTDNPAARGLYLDVGFRPDRQSVVLTPRPGSRAG